MLVGFVPCFAGAGESGTKRSVCNFVMPPTWLSRSLLHEHFPTNGAVMTIHGWRSKNSSKVYVDMSSAIEEPPISR
jgi:hypothetical protein